MTPANAAKTRKRINVTARDIALGRRNNTEFCPISRAARRVFTNGAVRTWWSELRVITETGIQKYELPREASDFVSDFDASGQGHPFRFYIEVNK